MKKILLTLFAVAAVVIACDKDALDQDVNNINVLEQAEEIGASVEADLSIVKGILRNLDFTGDLQETPAPKGGASTARTAGESTAANCIDNRPAVPAGKTAIDIQYLPDTTSEGYLFLRGGGDIPLALNRPILRFLIGSATEDIQLQLFLFTNGNFASPIPLGPTPYNAGLTFLATDGFISIDRTDLYLDSVTPNVTETASDAGVACSTGPVDTWSFDSATMTWSHPTLGSYIVSEAPFPLNGILARVLTQGTNPGTLHYAASGDMSDASDASHALNDALQRDF